MTIKKSLPWVILALLLGVIALIAVLRSPLGPLAQAALSQPRVYAYRDWQSMGVQLNPGDRIYLRARGSWSYTPEEFNGPEGHRIYRAPNTYPIPTIAGGILLGRVGEEGRIFPVGRGGTFTADEKGMLYLRINDDILSDNEGHVTVEIEATPVEDLDAP